jgi:hypothetical protein
MLNLQVVLMGDLNTLSPIDRLQHEKEGLMDLLKSSEHPCVLHHNMRWV